MSSAIRFHSIQSQASAASELFELVSGGWVNVDETVRQAVERRESFDQGSIEWTIWDALAKQAPRFRRSYLDG